MIAVDTNVLVCAHRPDSNVHGRARAAIASLLQTFEPWAITWPSVHEFVSTVTNPRMYHDPTPLDLAFAQLRELLAANVVLLKEGEGHFDTLVRLAVAGNALGPRIHDARIAAICIDHGVTELWTADRDFRRFPELRTRNPLV